MGRNKKSQSARARARERVAAMRQAEARRQRRNRLIVVAATVVGVAAVAAVVVIGLVTTAGPDDSTAAGRNGNGAETKPPWPVPADPSDRVEAAGLDLGPMGTAEHYHAHLDIIINGRPSPVPANIGVDPSTNQMSALHTHTADGVVHVEADRVGEPFTLGQLFTQWNVKLSPDQIGSLKATDSNPLAVYVNGKKHTGSPATLLLEGQQQIAIVYGDIDPTDIPSSYDFEGV